MKNKIRKILWIIQKILFLLKTLLILTVFRKSKLIFLFGTPYHPNMGDHAQTVCILKWLNENYPEFNIVKFSLINSSDRIINIIRMFIHSDDKIICHSGYHLTNLYHEQDVYFKLIKKFKDKAIVIFPQTINYTNNTALLEAQAVLNSHPNLTIMCRDEQSYATAQQFFSKVKLLLYPDIVTSLIGTKTFSYNRDGILFCMRDDIEAYYKPEQIEELKKRFVGQKTDHTDTTLRQYEMKYIYGHREEILDSIFDMYSHYKVVITDRYHGTIFSLISGTPVVVIGSTDHKLSSGVKWFPKEVFGKYIYFAKDLDEAYDRAIEIIANSSQYDYALPPYFKENYYDKLKSLLEYERN